MHTHTHHDHSHAPASHGRAFAIGIALNTAFVLTEIAYGFKADSLALLADAGHNASDVLGLLMAWGATWLARRRATDRYTYGLQSASILAALANALLLLIAVGGIGYEAIQRFGTPELPQTATVMAVAAIGVLINGITAWLLHSGSEHDLNMRGAFLHMLADTAVSAGVVLSAFTIGYTGWLWLDPVTSLAIVFFIVLGTWRLLRDSVALTLHAVPTRIDLAAVRSYLSTLPGVTEIHDLHVWAMSTTGNALSAHLLMQGGHPGDAFLQHVSDELAHHFHIGHATLQIEIGDANGHCHIHCGHDHG
jgi:cobalt-zinc-cadmium efflux system protein